MAQLLDGNIRSALPKDSEIEPSLDEARARWIVRLSSRTEFLDSREEVEVPDEALCRPQQMTRICSVTVRGSGRRRRREKDEEEEEE